ncbi:MAG TPA: DoxX family protein [Ilumatobacteraceae bacterium]
MNDIDALNLALLLFRFGVGGVMLAHGINHVFGGGKIAGTARWFGSMGMKNPMLQAWMASVTEIGGGAVIVLGVLTPFGGAAVIGIMTVAWIINHRTNGFFIFRPGEGWEYVMTLLLCGLLLATVGPGEWSLDEVFDVRDDLSGTTGLLIAAVAGGGGALLVLAASWRPATKPSRDA